MAQKKLIIYQDNIAEVGGVETALLNDVMALAPYYDLLVLYGNDKSPNERRIAEISKYCKVLKYNQTAQYECDILIRNSLYWHIPENIAVKEKIYEILHADYEWLYKTGTQFQEWNLAEKIGCGEFAATQYEKLHPGTKVKWIRNLLAPKKETKRVLRLITASRLAPEKGWNRMLKLCEMLKNAGIPYTWEIFTNSKLEGIVPEEMHIFKHRFDGIFDNLASADYLVQLSDTEGLPYSIQEALQYQTACLVTDIGGMTELVKDGVNGYVVPLDMNFDVTKLLTIPKFEEYKGTDVKEWLDLLGGAERVEKRRQYKICASTDYFDCEFNQNIHFGDIYIVSPERARKIIALGYAQEVEIIEEIIEEEKPKVKKTVAKKTKTTTEEKTPKTRKKKEA